MTRGQQQANLFEVGQLASKIVNSVLRQSFLRVHRIRMALHLLSELHLKQTLTQLVLAASVPMKG
jgi:hypothetical protein